MPVIHNIPTLKDSIRQNDKSDMQIETSVRILNDSNSADNSNYPPQFLSQGLPSSKSIVSNVII